MTKFIAVASVKGGTGKTTVALNLATALMRFGREIVLVDANLSNPNIALHLGTPKLPATLQDALQGKLQIRKTAYLHPSGLKVIPAGLTFAENYEEHRKRLKPVLMDLMGAAELVILDTPTGIEQNTQACLEIADEAIITTTPDLPSVTDAIKGALMCERVGCNVLGIVVNRYQHHQDELSVKEIAAMVDRQILAVVPEDALHRRALALQHPIQYTHPEAPAAIEIRKLAARILGQPYKDKI